MMPDYHNIFNDMIEKKDPNLKTDCEIILRKNRLSVLDIISLNKIIFGKVTQDPGKENQKYRAYDRNVIIEMLQYGQKHKLNNTQLAQHFNLSRNTVAKWKKNIILNSTDVG
ncbi:transposase [Chryseobacterium viscerum]|uniref:Transposase n=1 Tax=Chryseobacterium viscerum TaxID=1037377 RepID=A0A316WAK1_9FLAO|nr:transposase [Chryseobacterium viscerum]PWN58404.1 transposase [Chryseobacterium viscerum]